jgi:hypothetical protein
MPRFSDAQLRELASGAGYDRVPRFITRFADAIGSVEGRLLRYLAHRTLGFGQYATVVSTRDVAAIAGTNNYQPALDWLLAHGVVGREAVSHRGRRTYAHWIHTDYTAWDIPAEVWLRLLALREQGCWDDPRFSSESLQTLDRRKMVKVSAKVGYDVDDLKGRVSRASEADGGPDDGPNSGAEGRAQGPIPAPNSGAEGETKGHTPAPNGGAVSPHPRGRQRPSTGGLPPPMVGRTRGHEPLSHRDSRPPERRLREQRESPSGLGQASGQPHPQGGLRIPRAGRPRLRLRLTLRLRPGRPATARERTAARRGRAERPTAARLRRATACLRTPNGSQVDRWRNGDC